MNPKKKSASANDFAPPKSGGRTYTGELPEQAKLEEGDTVAGVFVDHKVITIIDQNTKKEKDIRVYTFRDKAGVKFAILGRTMLDTAFDNVVEHEGGEYANLKGMIVRIVRDKDTKLKGNKTLGNYTITCWESQ